MFAPAFIPHYRPETQDWIDGCATPPTALVRRAIDTLIRVGVKDGWWTRHDRFHFLAADTEQAALLDVRNPTKVMTAGNAITFESRLGYTGDAVSMYLHFTEVPDDAAETNFFSLDNACAWYYCNEQNSTTAKNLFTGGGTSCVLVGRGDSSNSTFTMNDGTNSTHTTSSATKLGFYLSSRNAASGAGSKIGTKNGADVATLNITSTVVGSAATARLLRNHSTTYDDSRLAAAGFGQSLDATQRLSLYNALLAALTVVGAN